MLIEALQAELADHAAPVRAAVERLSVDGQNAIAARVADFRGKMQRRDATRQFPADSLLSMAETLYASEANEATKAAVDAFAAAARATMAAARAQAAADAALKAPGVDRTRYDALTRKFMEQFTT